MKAAGTPRHGEQLRAFAMIFGKRLVSQSAPRRIFLAIEHDGIRSNYDRDEGALPLPLRERVGVRGSGLSIEHNPSPGSHLRCDPTSPARGEVNRVRL
jgi:hypothetical protein